MQKTIGKTDETEQNFQKQIQLYTGFWYIVKVLSQINEKKDKDFQ